MLQDLTTIYDGDDLSGATAGVIYLPILRDSTLQGVDALTDAEQTGDAVFEVRRNGVVMTGLDDLTIADGDKIGTISGLNVDLTKGDEIVLNLVSGSVSAPLTLNLTVDDGQAGGGGSGIFDSLVAVNNPGALADFDAVNDGDLIAAGDGACIVLNSPGNSADVTANIKALVKDLPAAPWTVTLGYTGAMIGTSPTYAGLGLMLYDSATQKVQVFQHLYLYNDNIFITNYDDPVTYNGDQISPVGTLFFAKSNLLYFLRLENDETNLILSESKDGKTWHVIASFAAGSFLSADKAGFFINERYINVQTVMRVFNFTIE